MGLHTDSIVGIQIANTVEAVLTPLGVPRAGLIAMPLPLLWRRAECVAALGRKARLADLGSTPLVGSPADFGKLIADDTEKWGTAKAPRRRGQRNHMFKVG